jgi:non-ribosomal peptide synthetase component E (peptide arylation enzyme)
MDDDVTAQMAQRASDRGWVFAPTLWELIEARATTTPDALLAHEDTGRELTFADYRDRCLRAAAGLYADHGVRSGSSPRGTSPWCWSGPWPASGPARTR